MTSDRRPQGLLRSAVVVLEPTAPGCLPATMGHLAHAAFLALLRQSDASLAVTLHDSAGRKPFTVSPLRRPGSDTVGPRTVRPGERYELRFTLLDELLFAPFTDSLLAHPRTYLRLGSVEFAVREVLMSPGAHPWAGAARWDELLERAPAAQMATLEFTSATAFNLGGPHGHWMEVFPAPRLLFGNLASAWERWGPTMDAGTSVRDDVTATVRVARYALETRMHDYGRYKQVGAVGTCSYEFRDPARPQLVRLLNALAEFAFFAGVGHKTTMGMGQVRRLPGKAETAP